MADSDSFAHVAAEANIAYVKPILTEKGEWKNAVGDSRM